MMRLDPLQNISAHALQIQMVVMFFKPLLDFMLIVRREISGGKSSISIDDIMLNLMQSKEELRKYHEFLKTNGYSIW